MIIAVDAAGGDYAPFEVVKGAIKAAEEFQVEIALVGEKSMLHVQAGKYLTKLPLSIVDAPQVIEFNEHPVRALRNKPNSTISVGTRMLKEGKANAFVSAGHTGACLVAAMLTLGVQENIPRPAIGIILNINPSHPTFLVDAGANVDCRAEHLVCFARMGSDYMNRVFGVEKPQVGLLSNGAEPLKGNRLVQETHPLLRDSGLNFIGNVEGHDIFDGKADVIVTDGFTGNVLLKAIEGLSDNWLESLTRAGKVLSKAYRQTLEDTQRSIGMDDWAKRLDYREYGGACLLGVNGNVIISHGRSQARAIKSAIGLAIRTAEHQKTFKMREKKNGQSN
jgi:glycerol-3-phosphate acyltransferase PlsX